MLSAGYVVFLLFMGAGDDVLLELKHNTAVGSVTLVGSPGDEEHDLCVLYTFTPSTAGKLKGHSYTADEAWATALVRGQPVTVQYLPNRPSVSRIEGMRRNFQSWRECLLKLPLYLLGVAAVLYLTVVYLRRRRLCESGVAATGQVLAPSRLVRALDWKLSMRGPWKWGLLSYRFEDRQGAQHVGRMKTGKHTASLKPGDPVMVIYDERSPRRSIVLEVYNLHFEECSPAQAGGLQ